MTETWTKKTTETLKQFSDCFEKVDGKERELPPAKAGWLPDSFP